MKSKLIVFGLMLFAGVITLLSSHTACAQATDAEKEKLAKLAQNPIAAAISVPLQYNFNFGYPPESQTGALLNIQPVVPLKLTGDWNYIVRTIMPIVNVPLPDGGSITALGDINFQTFFTPVKASKVIWGIGPTVTIPSAGNDMVGSEKFSMGPGLVLLTMMKPWVLGGLFNHQWSITGDDRRSDVNLTVINPFINLNLPEGWYLTTGPMITANWEADDDNVWTVPVGGGIGKVFRSGQQPLNAKLAWYYNAEKPDAAPISQLQFQLTLLFPN